MDDYDTFYSIVKRKSKLNHREAVLVIDLITFFIRRRLINGENFRFAKFGRLIYEKNKKINTIYFKNTHKNNRESVFKALNNLAPYNRENYKFQRCPEGVQVAKLVAKCLRIKIEEALFIFDLFLKFIYDDMLDNGKAHLKNFGTFYVKERKYINGLKYKNGLKMGDFVRKSIFFKLKTGFFEELNFKKKEMYATARVKKVLGLHNMADKIVIKK